MFAFSASYLLSSLQHRGVVGVRRHHNPLNPLAAAFLMRKHQHDASKLLQQISFISEIAQITLSLHFTPQT